MRSLYIGDNGLAEGKQNLKLNLIDAMVHSLF